MLLRYSLSDSSRPHWLIIIIIIIITITIIIDILIAAAVDQCGRAC